MHRHEFHRQLLELRPRLIAWALKRVHSYEDAEDLVQDTLVKAIAAWETFDPTRGSLKTWVSSIMSHRSADLKRLMSYRLTVRIDEAPLISLVEDATQQAHVERMDGIRIISNFSENVQDVLELTLMGYPDAEIARMRNMPLGTVKTHIRGSRQKVQRGLAYV